MFAAGLWPCRSRSMSRKAVVQRVDGRDVFIELDGVVENRPPVPHHDVGEMQIAMASAHEARGGALIERGGRCVELVRQRLRSAVPASRRSPRDSASDAAIDATSRRIGPRLRWRRGSARSWASWTTSARARARSLRYSCLPRDIAQQRRLVEPAHVHRPLDDLPCGSEDELSAATRAMGTQPR